MLTQVRDAALPVLVFSSLFVVRENLERLLDDKHFREEIVHFNISEETEVVDASHRARLIPLLMRYCTQELHFLLDVI